MSSNRIKPALLTVLSLLAMAFGLAGATARAQSNKPAKTWAIVIGISNYPRLPGGQQLQFADRDAAAFAEAMQKSGVSAERVRLLAGSDATAANIRSAVGNWAARSASEEDTVIIFFSGHGFYEPEFKESYLLASDSDVKDPYATAISVSDIKQALAARLRSRNVLIIADAVRRDLFDPDAGTTAAETFAQAFKELASSRGGVSTILASGPREFSREGQRWGGHGVFTKHALDALAGAGDTNRDGATSADEFFNYLTAHVSEDTSNKQHPWRSDVALAGLTISNASAQQAVVANPPPAPIKDPEPVKQAAATNEKAKESKEVRATEQPAPSKNTVAANSRAETPESKPPALTAEKDRPTAGDRQPQQSPPTSPPPAIARESGPADDVRKVSEPKSQERVEAGGPKADQRAPRKAPANQQVGVPPTDTLAANSPRRGIEPSKLPASNEASPAGAPEPPRPRRDLPSTPAVTSPAAGDRAPSISATLPASPAEPPAVSLLMQLEAAIYAKNLVEPKNASAWDMYQRAVSDPSAAAGLQRLKPMLADALLTYGKSIVGGDVRGDNIADKVDEFKKAGQVFARARSLQPANADLAALEKLSAAQALIALQFYDEAERALSQAQGSKLAAIENALGLTYQGKLENWRAERAFKRAIEIDPQWAAPHYNLAQLYRSQQNQAALEEFEQAARLDSANVAIITALGDEYFSRQQWNSAAEAFKRSIALNPSDDTLHTKLGHALFSQGLQTEANREYQKARELRGKP